MNELVNKRKNGSNIYTQACPINVIYGRYSFEAVFIVPIFVSQKKKND